MRLTTTVSWVADDRSTKQLHLTPKFALEWSKAIQKVHYIASLSLGKMQWEEMIEMRASNPNMFMNEKLWDWENIGNDP